MSYGVQVLIRGQVREDDRWEFVRPTGEPPYRYETEAEADNMMRCFYGAVVMKDKLSGTPGASVRVHPL